MAIVGEIPPRIDTVCFAIGFAQRGQDGAVAGPVLLRLLADLGISASAARSLLLRMRQEGWLSSQRSGRLAHYRLAPVIGAAQARVQRQLNGDRPAWNGSFSGVLYTVPERHRPFRDRLRRTAQLLGYVTLRPGLLIATTDRSGELTGLLPPRPPGSQVLSTRLTFAPSDSRSIAAQLWDLDSLAGRYRGVLADADRRTSRAERRPLPGAAAFRAFAAAAAPLYRTSAEDPDLPAELLPGDWPGQLIGPALSRAFRVFGPSLGEYLDSVSPASPASRKPHFVRPA